MSTEPNPGGTTRSPENAFAVLGNETWMEILGTLGGADGLLPFSDLRERVCVSDSGQFNYHLDKLTGHFLKKAEEGYRLRRAGERIIEAVLSGALSEAPVMSHTQLDQPCYYCGAPEHEWSVNPQFMSS